MEEVDFRDRTQSGTNLMARIRRFLQRAELDQNEVNILRGLLTAVQSRRGARAGQGGDGAEQTSIYLDYAATTPVDPAVVQRDDRLHGAGRGFRQPGLGDSCLWTPGGCARRDSARTSGGADLRRAGRDHLYVWRHGVEQPGGSGCRARQCRPAGGTSSPRALSTRPCSTRASGWRRRVSRSPTSTPDRSGRIDPESRACCASPGHRAGVHHAGEQ